MGKNDYDEIKKDMNIAISVCIFVIALLVLIFFLYFGEVEQRKTIDKCGSSDYKLTSVYTGKWFDERFVGYSCCKEIEEDYVFDKTTGKMDKEKSKGCFFVNKYNNNESKGK